MLKLKKEKAYTEISKKNLNQFSFIWKDGFHLLRIIFHSTILELVQMFIMCVSDMEQSNDNLKKNVCDKIYTQRRHQQPGK